MRTSRRTLRTVVVVLIALAVNAGLDVALDLPMLVRWAITLGVVVAVSAVIEILGRRSTATAPGSLDT